MLIIFFDSIDQQYWWPRKSLSHNYTRIWRHPYVIISLQSSFLAIHFFTWHEFFLFLYLLFAHTEYGIQKVQELEGDVAAKNFLLSDLRCDWRLTAAAAQGSSFIPGPRLIWTHPYTRQLTDRTENWKQYGQLIVVYRVDLD